jgi:hypothetical protein
VANSALCAPLVAGHGHLAAALILPLYYLVAATLTLLWRMKNREPFWQAHRTHFYQIATDRGFSVSEIVARVFSVNLALVALTDGSVLWPGDAHRPGSPSDGPRGGMAAARRQPGRRSGQAPQRRMEAQLTRAPDSQSSPAPAGSDQFGLGHALSRFREVDIVCGIPRDGLGSPVFYFRSLRTRSAHAASLS